MFNHKLPEEILKPTVQRLLISRRRSVHWRRPDYDHFVQNTKRKLFDARVRCVRRVMDNTLQNGIKL